MDASEFIPKLEQAVPGAVLEVRPFGRTGDMSVWVEVSALGALSRHLRLDPMFSFDWVENLSAMEIDGAIVLSYFLRSSLTGRALIMRGSIVPKSFDEVVEVVSTAGEWPSVAPQEDEIESLFGVRFVGAALPRPGSASPDGGGFPLRKSYAFPTEVLGFPHLRKKSGGAT